MVTNKDSNTLVITDFKDNIDTVKEVVSIMTNGGNETYQLQNYKI